MKRSEVFVDTESAELGTARQRASRLGFRYHALVPRACSDGCEHAMHGHVYEGIRATAFLLSDTIDDPPAETGEVRERNHG